MQQAPGVWNPVTSRTSGLGVLYWLKNPQGLEEEGSTKRSSAADQHRQEEGAACQRFPSTLMELPEDRWELLRSTS